MSLGFPDLYCTHVRLTLNHTVFIDSSTVWQNYVECVVGIIIYC